MDKTLATVTSFIIALTGLLVALKPLIEFLKQIFGPEKQPTKGTRSQTAPTGANKKQSTNSKNRDRKERPDMDTEIQAGPPLRRLMNKRFLFGVPILVAGVGIMAFLLLRTQPFQVEITNPKAGELMNVAAYKDAGKPTGDATYIVEGNYSGELGQALKIYVLVRAANKPHESWWIQEDESEIVVRKDRWFINGQWRQNAFFGRGKDSPEGPLKIGELWDIKAVVASRGQKGELSSDQSMTTQKAESQIVQVKIGNIVP